MRRVAGAVLVGLGVFLLLTAGLFRFYVYDRALVTPINQYAESNAPGTGTVFYPDTQQVQSGVALVAHRVLKGDVKASSDKTGVWDEFLALTDADGTTVQATTDRVAWDRKTAMAVHCCNENLTGKPVQHEGLSYKFPFHAKQTTYRFFDTVVGKAFDMTYSGTETLHLSNGPIKTYRYVQNIPSTDIGPIDLPGTSFGLTDPKVTAQQMYKNVRTVWVEPLTGVIIKGSEAQSVTADPGVTGASPLTLLDATLVFDDKTQAQQAKLAKDSTKQINLVRTWIPLAGLVLGLLALLGAAFVARRPHSGRPADERQPVAV